MTSPVIGVLGGIGPEATSEFYSKLIGQLQHRGMVKSNRDYPQIIINSIPAPELVGKIEEGLLKPYEEGLKQLESNKVDFIVMVCNTIHLYRDALQSKINVPIIDIRQKMQDYLTKNNINSVFIIGTKSTIEQGLYRFDNIKTLEPNEQEIEELTSSILKFNNGIEKEEQVQLVSRICQKYLSLGAEKIILGCTEFAVMLGNSLLPTINSIDLMVDSVIREIIHSQLNNMKTAVIACVHGNEKYGLEVIKKLPVSVPSFIGNEEAMKRNIRLIDSDLNRCFPGKADGNYEEKIAFELVEKLREFDYIIDLHSTSNSCPLFGIITKPNAEKIELAKKLGLQRVVIMPEYFAKGGALIDFMKCGISLEIGAHSRKENAQEALQLINNFLDNKPSVENIEIFEVVDIIKRQYPNVLIENFQPVKSGESISQYNDKQQIAEFDFVPVLVNEESYGDILCLACKPAKVSNYLYKQENITIGMEEIFENVDNKRLIEKFGAEPIGNLKETPDFYTFKTGVIASHRDFGQFFAALKKGEKCAIVSGVNASGTLHLGHKAVFDTNLFFQKKYGLQVFIPISDDESYVSGKVKTQEDALKNSMKLAKELLAYGFDPKKTYLIIDQIFTNIYNLAIKLSKKVTLSEIKSTYDYKNEDNPGLYFYPAVQSAHILLPAEKEGIKNILVPIGPDEDAHIRICRDLASRFGYRKPSILHTKFLPGIDGQKMSKSKGNAIFLDDDEKTVRKKISQAFSGGQKTLEEHRKLGGNPDVDVSYIYLKSFFLEEKEAKKIYEDYKKGKILSGDMKKMFADKVVEFLKRFQSNLKKIDDKTVNSAILKNN